MEKLLLGVQLALLEGMGSNLSLGIVLGLVLGKPVGILVFSNLAVRMRWAELPSGANWVQLLGVGILGGIGFTMSIFIAGLAFDGGRDLDQAKLGILGASLLSGVVGYYLLKATAFAPEPDDRHAIGN